MFFFRWGSLNVLQYVERRVAAVKESGDGQQPTSTVLCWDKNYSGLGCAPCPPFSPPTAITGIRPQKLKKSKKHQQNIQRIQILYQVSF